VYKIGKEIGQGKYGKVRLVAKKSYEKKRFALKSLEKHSTKITEEQIKREFSILRDLDHPNIIKFYEIYGDDKYFHFITEFCGGGELFEHIISRGGFSEEYGSRIIK
jgi:calcium-dependent protein kinase